MKKSSNCFANIYYKLRQRIVKQNYTKYINEGVSQSLLSGPVVKKRTRRHDPPVPHSQQYKYLMGGWLFTVLFLPAKRQSVEGTPPLHSMIGISMFQIVTPLHSSREHFAPIPKTTKLIHRRIIKIIIPLILLLLRLGKWILSYATQRPISLGLPIVSNRV